MLSALSCTLLTTSIATASAAPAASTTAQNQSTKAERQADAQSQSAEKAAAQAIEAYKQEDFSRALTSAREAVSLAPKNGRLRSILAVVEARKQPLLYSLSTAKEAARLSPGDANALTNYGILLQKNGQRADAVDFYKKAENLDSRDFRPRVGIAQCLGVDGADGLTIADRELKAASGAGEDTVEKWTAIGLTYLVLRNGALASNAFGHALKLDPQNYNLKVLRIKSAMAEHDTVTVKAMAGDIVGEKNGDKLADRDVALGLALLPDNDFSPEQKHRLIAICQKSFFGQGDFFYLLARNFEVDKHLDMAYECYQLALHYNPGDCQFIVSEIGNRLAAGRDDEAMTIWGQSSSERKKNAASGTGSPSSSGTTAAERNVFVHVFNSIGELLQVSDPGIHIVRANFKNVKCGCRLPVIKTKLIAQPGVVFATLEDAKDYPTTVVYDVKKNSVEAIFKHARQAEDNVEVISDTPVQSIPELVRLIQLASDKPDKHIFSLWSFSPPPMELPK